MTKILDGKEESKKILAEQAIQASKIAKNGYTVGFAMLAVGEDPAIIQYALSNKRACEKIGILSTFEVMPEESTTQDVYDKIQQLNSDLFVNAILVLTPLPKHIDARRIMGAINPAKDIDGQTPDNISMLYSNIKGCFCPSTPLGAMRLMQKYKIDLDGKHAVIVGRSPVVGKPLALMLLNANATVTVCHTHTQNLTDICRRADILIACAGVPKMIKGNMVKKDAVVIDIGTNFVDGKLCGDVDFDSVNGIAGAISPVPGGCGPMTVAAMMENVISATKKQKHIR